jgi:hypothetical protein
MIFIMKNVIKMLETGGGKILCRRCTAMSKRTGEQCKKPALKISRTEKCRFHGGLSTGARTAEGKARSGAASYKTGEYSKAEIDKANRSRALLRVLEDAAHLLGLVPKDAPRARGRKPKLYFPVTRSDDVLPAILELRD